MLVDNGGNVETLEERSDECQGSEVEGVVVDSGSVPGVRHKASAGKGWQWQQGGWLRVVLT
jgi:hypothetical protein